MVMRRVYVLAHKGAKAGDQIQIWTQNLRLEARLYPMRNTPVVHSTRIEMKRGKVHNWLVQQVLTRRSSSCEGYNKLSF